MTERELIVILRKYIENGGDPKYFDCPYIFSIEDTDVLWHAALKRHNEKAFHFIVTNSRGLTRKSCVYKAMRNASVSGAACAMTAYIRETQIERIYEIFYDLYSIYPETTIQLIETLNDYELVDDYILYGRQQKEGPFFAFIQHVARRNWSVVCAAVCIQKMWKQFLEKSLRPESRFMSKFSQKAQHAFSVSELGHETR